MDLNTLRQAAASCTSCELHKGRINPVFDKGNPQSRLMICGMVPAYEENKQGVPFVGRAGQLLDVILRRTHINDVYITNLVKCFLAPGKKLKSDWINPCLAYIVNQINIVFPYAIITLGADATNTLLGMPEDTSIGKMRGREHEWGGRIKIVPTYHPSFLLRQGGESSKHFNKVIDDFTLARNIVDEEINRVMNESVPMFYSSGE